MVSQVRFLDLLLPVIKLKTLILQGAQSKVIHPATPGVVEAMMSDVQAAVIENCGHFPMIEQPQTTAQHMLEFFKEILPPASA